MHKPNRNAVVKYLIITVSTKMLFPCMKQRLNDNRTTKKTATMLMRWCHVNDWRTKMKRRIILWINNNSIIGRKKWPKLLWVKPYLMEIYLKRISRVLIYDDNANYMEHFWFRWFVISSHLPNSTVFSKNIFFFYQTEYIGVRIEPENAFKMPSI